MSFGRVSFGLASARVERLHPDAFGWIRVDKNFVCAHDVLILEADTKADLEELVGRRQMIGSGTCLTTYRGQKFLCSPDSGDACTEWPDERKPAAQPLKPK